MRNSQGLLQGLVSFEGKVCCVHPVGACTKCIMHKCGKECSMFNSKISDIKAPIFADLDFHENGKYNPLGLDTSIPWTEM